MFLLTLRVNACSMHSLTCVFLISKAAVPDRGSALPAVYIVLWQRCSSHNSTVFYYSTTTILFIIQHIETICYHVLAHPALLYHVSCLKSCSLCWSFLNYWYFQYDPTSMRKNHANCTKYFPASAHQDGTTAR